MASSRAVSHAPVCGKDRPNTRVGRKHVRHLVSGLVENEIGNFCGDDFITRSLDCCREASERGESGVDAYSPGGCVTTPTCLLWSAGWVGDEPLPIIDAHLVMVRTLNKT